MGLAALQKNRAILDFSSLKLHFCGPGDIKIDSGLPAGTESFQLETAPSGHLVLPCCEYKEAKPHNNSSLTLMTGSSSSGGQRTETAGVPPPPEAPPVLTDTMLSERTYPAAPQNIEEINPALTLPTTEEDGWPRKFTL